jgi:ComF family protein
MRLNYFFDLILPRFCQACKNKLSSKEEIICNSCLCNIKRADNERLKHEFERKFLNDKIISGFTSYFVFEKDKEFQSVIHNLKYNSKFSIGTILGKIMGTGLREQFAGWAIDYIVPVPLHHLKRAERGYNQSEFIARGIKKTTGIPVKTNLIKRLKYTETQTGFNLAERKKNMDGAFCLKKKYNLQGKTFLIIDDVITTGATITECGNILLRAGALKVYAASVAVAE